MTLNDRWEVIHRETRGSTQTGSFFSVGYKVRDKRDGREAFLKALNFDAALREPDPARAMFAMTEQFTFEKDLLEFCKGQSLSRIVRAVDHGIVHLGSGAADIVQFIVFEPADGDLRKLISGFREIELSWTISVVHQAAVGMKQLHGQQIAHQDLKPSNILSFGGRVDTKLADLGCASRSGHYSPRDGIKIPGARPYAAPELIYGQLDKDWQVRRLAPDLFQLGSIICFMYTGHTMLALLLDHLPAKFRPKLFGGDYAGTFADAKAFLEDAYSQLLEDNAQPFEDECSKEMFSMMTRLCNPDPLARGFGGKKWSGANRYALDPFVSKFALLEARTRYAAKRVLRAVEGEYSVT
jgi:serine/threonine protein kinase